MERFRLVKPGDQIKKPEIALKSIGCEDTLHVDKKKTQSEAKRRRRKKSLAHEQEGHFALSFKQEISLLNVVWMFFNSSSHNEFLEGLEKNRGRIGRSGSLAVQVEFCQLLTRGCVICKKDN